MATIAACNSDKTEETWKEYKEYRDVNVAYYNEQAALLDQNGEPYYTKVVPTWNMGAEILIHYFNDRSKTVNNLTPMLTSTCAVSYIGRLYNGQAFDSSFTATTRVRLFKPQNTIVGWWIALEQMHVGDSVRVVIPYTWGYGSSGSTSGVIPPFATLTFDMMLEDITAYEIEP